MNKSPTYLFYDLETSGLNPAFDQILQFAAIRTDEAFQELSRHEFRVRLRPDIIPSPAALLATDVSVLKALTTGVCEYEAVQEIHALFNQPNTINLGYNSLSFDDQFLRFSFYRNLLPVYDHQWKNGCKRLDIFPIIVWYWLADSNLLKWPLVNDKPNLRLEHLKEENGLAEGRAHDALVDVAATVELARRLHRDEALWQSAMIFFDKNSFKDRLSKHPKFLGRPNAILVHSKYGYDQNCQLPVIYLGEKHQQGTRSLWLRLDQPELRQTTTSQIEETTWVIHKKPGEPPFMVSPKSHKLSVERLEITRNNLGWLKQNEDILIAIEKYYGQSEYMNTVTPDTDATLYSIGFPSSETENWCVQFHQSTIAEKMTLVEKYEDAGINELAIRLLCRNYGVAYRYPAYAAYLRCIMDNENPLQDYRGQPRLTPQAALAEIEIELQKDITASQEVILSDLEKYIRHQFFAG